MQLASFPSNKMAYLCWENKLNWKRTEMNNKKFPGHINAPKATVLPRIYLFILQQLIVQRLENI